jgi:hypothetical protein
MMTLIAMVLTAIGLMLVFYTKYLLIGCAFIGLSTLAWKKHNIRSEFRLEVILFVMAALGIAATIIEQFIGHFVLS